MFSQAGKVKRQYRQTAFICRLPDRLALPLSLGTQILGQFRWACGKSFQLPWQVFQEHRARDWVREDSAGVGEASTAGGQATRRSQPLSGTCHQALA